MPVFSSFVVAVYTVADSLLGLYFWIIVASAVISWINADPYNPIVRGIRALTEPVFYQVRKWMPFLLAGGFDFSPVVVIIALQFFRVFLGQLMVRV